MDLLIILLVSFLFSMIFHPVAIWVSNSFNIFDNPYRDQIHKKPTPVLGGVAISFAVLFTILIARITGIYVWSRVADGFLVGGGLIVLVGFIDDRFGINPAIKLVGQIISASMFVIFTKASIGIFHPLVEFSVLIFGLVTMMNAFNILDNMDGVTGSMSFACALAFLTVGVISEDHNQAVALTALIGALIGFLRYNFPRAKIFMGDAGAMLLGFMLGAFAIVYMMNHKSYYLLTTPFLILSYPIFDIALVSLSRMREKRSLAVAAPDSSPYRLARWIFTTQNAFLVVFLINLIMGVFGVMTYILKENQISVLLIFISGLSLSVLGVHLYRNFLYFIERTFFFILDIVSINLSFYLLYSLKYNWGIFEYEVYIPYSEMFAPTIWISIFWVLLFSIMGLYEFRPDRRFSDYVLALLKVIGLGIALFLITVISLEGNIVVSILPVLLYMSVLFILNCILKYATFSVIRKKSNTVTGRPRAVIYIKNSETSFNDILDLAKQRFKLTGYVSSENLKLDSIDLAYLGDEKNLSEIIKEKRIEKIILAWPDNDYSDYLPVINSYFYLENHFLLMGKLSDPFAGFKTIKLYRPGFVRFSVELMRTWEWMFKRGFDIIISMIILAVTSPIFLYRYIQSKLKNTPFMVKISIFGRDGQIKNCYDFYDHALKHSGKDVIKLGLPSLISIIEGNLSLVGTLPITVNKANMDDKNIPGFWRRKLIKPGIFGLAHKASPDGYFKRELHYMEKMSVLYDIYVLISGILYGLKVLPGEKENARS